MPCTAPFEANLDVSGIGVSTQLMSTKPGHPLILHPFQILLAFYTQAILNFALLTWSDALSSLSPEN